MCSRLNLRKDCYICGTHGSPSTCCRLSAFERWQAPFDQDPICSFKLCSMSICWSWLSCLVLYHFAYCCGCCCCCCWFEYCWFLTVIKLPWSFPPKLTPQTFPSLTVLDFLDFMVALGVVICLVADIAFGFTSSFVLPVLCSNEDPIKKLSSISKLARKFFTSSSGSYQFLMPLQIHHCWNYWR